MTPRRAGGAGDLGGPSFDEIARYTSLFGVEPTQIQHDFVVSHVLSAIAEHRDRIVFFGGTALSRTYLDGLRLSEDIDLLAIGSRAEVARMLDGAIGERLERRFGVVDADPWLSETRVDTDPCVFHIGGTDLRIQLLRGDSYPRWPTTASVIEQRYAEVPDITLMTLTASGFTAAKTVAWCDESRNAPRDLYDLWALGQRGHINAAAAAEFKRHGPTGRVPSSSIMPRRPPTDREWRDALAHQCIPRVGPKEAYEQVRRAWAAAVSEVG